MNQQQIESELKRIYAQLPTIECKKQCTAYCTTIMLTELEHELILKAEGSVGPTEGYVMSDRALTPGQPALMTRTCGLCPALKDGLCSVYDRRPLICRVFGLTQLLRCPFGCTPSRWLSERESKKLFMRMAALSAKTTNQ